MGEKSTHNMAAECRFILFWINLYWFRLSRPLDLFYCLNNKNSFITTLSLIMSNLCFRTDTIKRHNMLLEFHVILKRCLLLLRKTATEARNVHNGFLAVLSCHNLFVPWFLVTTFSNHWFYINANMLKA